MFAASQIANFITILHPKKGKSIDKKKRNKKKIGGERNAFHFNSLTGQGKESMRMRIKIEKFISFHFDFPLNLNKIEKNELLNTIPMSIQ